MIIEQLVDGVVGHTLSNRLVVFSLLPTKLILLIGSRLVGIYFCQKLAYNLNYESYFKRICVLKILRN